MLSTVGCREKARLVGEVQETLAHISELLSLEREAMEDEAENLTDAIEGEIAKARVEEEHTLAVLREHCKRHGC